MPVIILGGLGTHLTSLDESAALAALYTLVVEVFIHKDLSLKKDLPRVAKASMCWRGRSSSSWRWRTRSSTS